MCIGSKSSHDGFTLSVLIVLKGVKFGLLPLLMLRLWTSSFVTHVLVRYSTLLVRSSRCR